METAMRRSIPATILVLGVALLLNSCSSWQRSSALSEPIAREKHYSQFRVEPVRGPALVLRNPWFSGDTLYGRSKAGTRRHGSEYARGDTVAIPLDQITKLEARRFSGTKTLFLVVGVGATVALVAAAVALSNWDGPLGGCCTSGGSGTYSCPLIFSWDGKGWWLDSGTYAGALMPALARTDVDNLDHAEAHDGAVRLRVTGVPGETEHVDAIRLLAVDHDPLCMIAPDAKGTLHSLGTLREPATARDFKGRDMLRLVRTNDELSWESVPTGRDTTREEDIRDGLEIEFPRDPRATEARLVVDGRYTAWADYLTGEYVQLHGRETEAWYRDLSSNPSKARAFAAALAREAFLTISVWDGERWSRQGSLPGAGPELTKRQVVPLDLSIVRGDMVRVRLETAPALWMIDRVALDQEPEAAFSVREIELSEARDLRGRDVRAPLVRADGEEFVMEQQDTLELRFAVDPTPPGRARSYIAATTGWYRIHTSESGEPDSALAERLIREPRAISRLSVARMNDALRSLAAER